MRPLARRRFDVVLLVLAAGVLAAAAIAGAFAGDNERIGAYWLHAHIEDQRPAAVHEVIDYDFGSSRKHGILRWIPEVDWTGDFQVESPTAPDQVRVNPWTDGAELRIGDPDATISNRHRYDIRYEIDTLGKGDRVVWDAIGSEWDVEIHDIEIHVTADRELIFPTCDAGRAGAFGGCTVQQLEPGHLLVRRDRSSPGHFVTVGATLGAATTATAPVAPRGAAPDPGRGWKLPGLLAFATALAAAGGVSVLVRRLGREWAWAGGPADAAFGPPTGETFARRRLDHAELAELATIEFEAPRDLSAAAGGVIHDERVTDDHKIAWLLECDIRDEIDMHTDPKKIRRGSATPHPAVAPTLDRMFDGRSKISLKSYDETFTKGWEKLGDDLESWRKESGLWHASGRRRRSVAIGLGIIAGIAGLTFTAVGAAFANRAGATGWLLLVAIGGAIGGGGLGALIRAWELRVRTAEGSGIWLRVESFRRFLANSEARHVERAAEMGLLRQYTAWAVALDEVDHWQRAVDAAVAVPGSAAAGLPAHHIAMGGAVHSFSSGISTASTAPSSSGSGGFGGGGGGAGGGGGGGGGGSW